MRRIRRYLQNNIEAQAWLILAVCVGGIGVCLVFMLREAREWEAFKVARACVKVAEIAGETILVPGIGAQGGVSVGVATTSSKTGWHCDDGITYYR